MAGRLVLSTNPWGPLELPETTEDMVQGRLGSGSHSARVFMTWSIIIMMTLLFVTGIYLLQKHLENINNILKISSGVLQQYPNLLRPFISTHFAHVTLYFLSSR